MKVIIPVAGYGTRLKPHTDKIQKTVLPVAGKPILDHILAPLFEYNIRHITFIVGHLKGQVADHMKKYNGNFSFVEQTERLGLGHAVLQGLQDTDDPVLVQLGDSIFNIDYSDLCSSQTNQLVVEEVYDPSRFGIVEVLGDRIVDFYEKDPDPPGNLAIAGLYFFTNESQLKDALEYLIDNNIKTKNEYQLTDALKVMVERGSVFNSYSSNNYIDVGIPADFLKANKTLLKPHHDDINGVNISDPVYIGENCNIKNSSIGPYVTIMNNCSVINCQIVDSIVLDGARLKDLSINHQIVAGDGSEYC
jgi:glucose-1-phosphate thymidylyltransferase